MSDISYQELEAGPKADASVLYDKTLKWAKELGWTGRVLEQPGMELTSGFSRDRTIQYIQKIIHGNEDQARAAIPKQEFEDTVKICALAKMYMEGMRSYQDRKLFSAPVESLREIDKAKFNRALVAEAVYRSNPNTPYAQEVSVDIEPKASFPGVTESEESEMRQVLGNMGAQRKEGDAHDPAKVLVLKTSLENAVRSIAYTHSVSVS